MQVPRCSSPGHHGRPSPGNPSTPPAELASSPTYRAQGGQAQVPKVAAPRPRAGVGTQDSQWIACAGPHLGAPQNGPLVSAVKEWKCERCERMGSKATTEYGFLPNSSEVSHPHC